MRQTRRELVLSFDEFRTADYGQLCQFLGLRPSKPHLNAAGQDTRRRRGRREVRT